MSNNQDESDEESSRKRLTVPIGFRNLLENLTLEILRSNPSDIYKFAAEYFKSRLQERQGRRIVQYCCYIESSRKRLTVPSGFRNLLENLTLEILRSNPSDIYKFAAEYFKSRLQERQGRRIVQYCCQLLYL